MKQIILPFKTGKPRLIEVAAPQVQPGQVLIRTTVSVVSTGTERMLLEFGKAGMIGKMRQQPEKVRQVLDKLRADGLAPTIKAVKSKLDIPIPLGYSQAGVVIGVGAGINDIKIGDRVASNGHHAEIVSVPRNLVARIPEGLSDEPAAFTVLGAIALQSIRLVAPSFGETVVVIGLGLIGQLTAQLLIANGCRVIGSDLAKTRMQQAAASGVQILEDLSEASVRAVTGGHGADAVIITASSDDAQLLALAAELCRKRGRIVLTGVVPLTLNRDQFFKKEISFQVSTSYGPGRYERSYEQQGLDYPIGYVRWTEGRNFEAVLHALQSGKLNVAPLISARVPFENAAEAYGQLDNSDHFASIFTYQQSAAHATTVSHATTAAPAPGNGIAIIGAGNFTAGVLLPALKANGAALHTIVSRNGLSAAMLAEKYGIAKSGTDADSVITDKTCSAVLIATPHNTHAGLASAALDAGKHVFVEKPLALSDEQLAQVEHAFGKGNATLTVGFNRRYAPFAIAAKNLLGQSTGKCNIIITVNAGSLAKDHWLQDESVGGGRLAGEACHFIDLCAYFAGSPIVALCANAITDSGMPVENASILLRFADGSNAVVNYFSNGSKAYDKERVELYKGGGTIIIESWRAIRSYGFKKDISRRGTQDKGHNALIAAWLQCVQDKGKAPIAAQEIFNSSRATIAVAESIRTNAWLSL